MALNSDNVNIFGMLVCLVVSCLFKKIVKNVFNEKILTS